MSVALPVTPVAVRPVTRTSSAVMAPFLAIATVAATIDLMTKELATSLLGHGQLVELTNKIGFLLVYNTGTAGGLSIGPFTAAINVLVTIVAIAMVQSRYVTRTTITTLEDAQLSNSGLRARNNRPLKP